MTILLLGGGPGSGVAGGGGGGAGAEATAFLARTTGLDATHTNAYIALINGLVADGLWSKLDLLHIYATQDTTTAQLNLVQTSYPATLISAPSFTVDRGYTGAGSSYIKTGFIPSSASSPKSTQNSAHISVWNLTNATTSWQAVGGSDGTTTYSIVPRLSDGNSYFGPNTGSSSSISVSNADARGHFLANRSSSVQADGYKNGSSVVSSGASGSAGTTTVELYALALNSSGSPLVVGYQEAMISVGSSMNATEAGNFYSRLRTYMTAVGVP